MSDGDGVTEFDHLPMEAWIEADIGTNGTSATYVLVQADVGSTITVNAQYTDDLSTTCRKCDRRSNGCGDQCQ